MRRVGWGWGSRVPVTEVKWITPTLPLRCLPTLSLQIDTARGKALADEYGALFFETSAKDGTGVKGAFHALAALAVATADGSTAGGAGAGGGGVKQIKGGKGKDGKDCSIM